MAQADVFSKLATKNRGDMKNNNNNNNNNFGVVSVCIVALCAAVRCAAVRNSKETCALGSHDPQADYTKDYTNKKNAQKKAEAAQAVCNRAATDAAGCAGCLQKVRQDRKEQARKDQKNWRDFLGKGSTRSRNLWPLCSACWSTADQIGRSLDAIYLGRNSQSMSRGIIVASNNSSLEFRRESHATRKL